MSDARRSGRGRLARLDDALLGAPGTRHGSSGGLTTRRWWCLLVAALLPLAWLPFALRALLGTDGYPRWFLPVQSGFVVYGFALLVVSALVVRRDPALTGAQRAGWLIAVVFLSPLGLLAYLFRHGRTPERIATATDAR